MAQRLRAPTEVTAVGHEPGTLAAHEYGVLYLPCLEPVVNQALPGDS